METETDHKLPASPHRGWMEWVAGRLDDAEARGRALKDQIWGLDFPLINFPLLPTLPLLLLRILSSQVVTDYNLREGGEGTGSSRCGWRLWPVGKRRVPWR